VSANADALHEALLMAPDARAERANRMRAAAVRLPPAEWFQAQLDALPSAGQSA
jgi:trehalose 6-phosphate synthase